MERVADYFALHKMRMVMSAPMERPLMWYGQTKVRPDDEGIGEDPGAAVSAYLFREKIRHGGRSEGAFR